MAVVITMGGGGTGGTGGGTGSGGTGSSGGSRSSGSGSGDGAEGSEAPRGFLENPGPESFQSGIGVISGWVCEAEEVEIEINGSSQPAAYGTARLDTEVVCGDTNNGFGLLFNWNLLGAGEHAVVVRVDGVEWQRTAVTVTTVGEGVAEEFLPGVAGACVVQDFPQEGARVRLVWQEANQNFVVASGVAPAGASQAGVAGASYLDSPAANSFQSGIGVIAGWVCEAEGVEIVFETEQGEEHRFEAGYGTERGDTAALPDGTPLCGDTDNGFGLLFNWNLLDDGEHRVVAYADGVAFGWAVVRVTTVGEGLEKEFLPNAVGECLVEDFPMEGQTTTLEWQQSSQNFVVTAREP